MSAQTLLLLTVAEIVLLVVVLAIYLMLITARLRSLANILGQLDSGVQLVGQHVSLLGPGVQTLNAVVKQIGTAVPWLADRAEALGRDAR